MTAPVVPVPLGRPEMPSAATDSAGLGALVGLDRLVSPLGGLVSRVFQAPTSPGDAPFPVFSASLGDLAAVHPNVLESTQGRPLAGQMDGAGGGVDPARASRIAVAEALERHASSIVEDSQTVWASADELGDEGLDVDALPRCSAAELAHPRCPVVPFDRSQPVRWVRAWSLTRGRAVFVPAVLVWLHVPPRSRAERFALPISTGCATHNDLVQAVLNGLCEVIERDAISLVWLQRLALRRIELDAVPGGLAPFLERGERGGVRTLLFDATTDVGVPTVYSLELAEHDPRVAQLVMCATDLDPAVAVAKVLREAASSRIALHIERPVPDDVDAFHNVFHGAVYMGDPKRRRAFDFLTRSATPPVPLSALARPATGDPAGDLAVVLERLRAVGAEAVAVDVTSDEAADVGFRVVRTIVPQLMPLSFSYRARWLGHPRLYQAPPAMGHPAHTEAGLNPWPQPFA